MKKYLSVLLAAVMILSLLAGCGSKPAETPVNPARHRRRRVLYPASPLPVFLRGLKQSTALMVVKLLRNRSIAPCMWVKWIP